MRCLEMHVTAFDAMFFEPRLVVGKSVPGSKGGLPPGLHSETNTTPRRICKSSTK
jgi:hypothetical protein